MNVSNMEEKKMNDCCEVCIWAHKRDTDTIMRLCRYHNMGVYKGSMPCNKYERYDDNFYVQRSPESAVQ